MQVNDPIEQAIDAVLSEAAQSSYVREIASLLKGVRHISSVTLEVAMQALINHSNSTHLPAQHEVALKNIDWSALKDSDFEKIAPEFALRRYNNNEPCVMFWISQGGKKNPIKGRAFDSFIQPPIVPPMLATITGPGQVFINLDAWQKLRIAHINDISRITDYVYVLSFSALGDKKRLLKKQGRYQSRLGAFALWSPEDNMRRAQKKIMRALHDRYPPERISFMVQKLLSLTHRMLSELWEKYNAENKSDNRGQYGREMYDLTRTIDHILQLAQRIPDYSSEPHTPEYGVSKSEAVYLLKFRQIYKALMAGDLKAAAEIST